MTADDVEELCSLRLAFELLALKFAMTNARESNYVQINKSIDSFRKLLKRTFSLEEAVDIDLRFHEEPVKASGHSRLISLWQSIRSQIWFLIFSRNVYYVRSFPKDANEAHVALLELLQNKDYKGGEKIIQNHLEFAYRDLISTYRESEQHERAKPQIAKKLGR